MAGKRLRVGVGCHFCKAEVIHFVFEDGKWRPVFKGLHTLKTLADPSETQTYKTVLVCDDCYCNPRHRYPGAPPLREETPSISIHKRKQLARAALDKERLDKEQQEEADADVGYGNDFEPDDPTLGDK